MINIIRGELTEKVQFFIPNSTMSSSPEIKTEFTTWLTKHTPYRRHCTWFFQLGSCPCPPLHRAPACSLGPAAAPCVSVYASPTLPEHWTLADTAHSLAVGTLIHSHLAVNNNIVFSYRIELHTHSPEWKVSEICSFVFSQLNYLFY